MRKLSQCSAAPTHGHFRIGDLLTAPEVRVQHFETEADPSCAACSGSSRARTPCMRSIAFPRGVARPCVSDHWRQPGVLLSGDGAIPTSEVLKHSERPPETSSEAYGDIPVLPADTCCGSTAAGKARFWEELPSTHGGPEADARWSGFWKTMSRGRNLTWGHECGCGTECHLAGPVVDTGRTRLSGVPECSRSATQAPHCGSRGVSTETA